MFSRIVVVIGLDIIQNKSEMILAGSSHAETIN